MYNIVTKKSERFYLVLLVVGMFLGMISPKVFAQEVGSTNIIGKVVDQYGNPVSDVTITMKNSDLKVITGIDGVFTFQMKKGDVLRLSHPEFIHKEVKVNKISFLKKPCIHYIQREGSISNSQNERTKEIFDVLDNVIKYYKENDFYEKYKQQLEYLYARYAFCSSLLRIVKIQDEEVQEKMLEFTWEKVNKEFPNWKQNEILKKGNGLSRKYKIYNLYMKTLNKFTYKLYTTIMYIIKK